ncbi:MAG: hypothetical protein M0Z36_04200 [Thermaerobacter sp.]|nr:hypothetical protein [Thermaerobacter sp.]
MTDQPGFPVGTHGTGSSTTTIKRATPAWADGEKACDEAITSGRDVRTADQLAALAKQLQQG